MAETPVYWSLTPEEWESWVTNLGIVAASKMAGACIAYFFYGVEPDIKLTKQAQALFNAERKRLDRRRASAMNGRRACSQAESGDVENKKPTKKQGRKPTQKQSEKTPKKTGVQNTPRPAKTHEASPPPTYISQSLHHNPQTPAPSERARGSGVVSMSEYAELCQSIGFDSATAHGWRAVS